MDPILLFLPLLLVMLVFMWRSNRKRQEQMRQMQDRIVIGAEVMTNTGLFGTIVDRDEDEQSVTLESTPGTRLRVHSTTIARVIEPEVPDDASRLVADEAEPLEEELLEETDPLEPAAEGLEPDAVEGEAAAEAASEQASPGEDEPGARPEGGDHPLDGSR
ncbi:MAG: preprotein translocase subunit YajC [Pseudoclavibacter sp.]|nr:preprotein translocase subunit YajC [Pseudoclavibacter sp.]